MFCELDEKVRPKFEAVDDVKAKLQALNDSIQTLRELGIRCTAPSLICRIAIKVEEQNQLTFLVFIDLKI